MTVHKTVSCFVRMLGSILLLHSLVLFYSFHYSAEAAPVIVALENGKQMELYSDYYALVVGVSSYSHWSRLPGAVDDARDVAKHLRQIGFRVKEIADPTSLELKKAFNDLVIEVGQDPDRAVLVYYSGHSTTWALPDGTEAGWLIPSDCPRPQDDPDGFLASAISTAAISVYAEDIVSKHVFMIFDTALMSNRFSTMKPVLKAITEQDALPVRQYIISRKPGEAASQNKFKELFLKGIGGEADFIHDGNITASELAQYLIDRVEKMSGGKQHPIYAKAPDEALARGDFIIKPLPPVRTTARVFIHTNPEGAQVRILNIKPQFTQGMELPSGKYHVEVSLPGYQTISTWITLNAGEDVTEKIELKKRADMITNRLGMQFVFIKPGSYLMGSPPNEKGRGFDEEQHRVQLTRGVYMQTSEVTVGQFRSFVEATGYKTEAEKSGGCWVSAEGGRWKKQAGSSWKSPGSWENAASRQTDDYPVACVSWNDIQAFIKWISRKENETYDLPTEAEWEYACRAGTKTPFAYGKCLSSDQANYGGVDEEYANCKKTYRTDNKKPIKVASLAPNPWKLQDMHGNVAEWCRDRYGPYPSGNATDPQGPPSGTDRVIRGGHWFTKASATRCASRSRFIPSSASDAIGFRLVMRH